MEKKNVNRTRIIKCRLTLQEYQILEKKWKTTACNKLSEYIRKCLFEKPITTFYRNKSEDDGLAELSRLRTELNQIGNNFNQAVKRLNTTGNSDEFRSWATSYELERRVLSNKVDEIKKHMQKMVERWLQ